MHRVFIRPLFWIVCVLLGAGSSHAQTNYEPYLFTTLAGEAPYGSTDGKGSAARFNQAYGVATDSAGNVYVADTYNSTIRKITPDGTVTTFAGAAGEKGSVDGTGSGARFYAPYGIALDSLGNVYVADTGNQTIRKITPDGIVSTGGWVGGPSWQQRWGR